MFAYAARDHSKHYGTTVDQYAKITYKNRMHGAMNSRACYQVCAVCLLIKLLNHMYMELIIYIVFFRVLLH